MNAAASLASRSRLSRGGRWVAAALFTVLGVGILLAAPDPGGLEWSLFAVAMLGLVTVIFWRASGKQEEDERERELVETARAAIQGEARRLDSKRQDLEKVLIAYGEWMEFPDYAKLQETDWRSEAHVEFDDRVASLLDDEADLVIQRFSSGVYWSEGRFESRRLLLDLFSFTESVARIYRPDAELPLMELDLESLLKAVNRASLQIILLLEEVPVVELQQMNLRRMSEHIHRASKVYRKYEEWRPYIEPMRYLWQGSKMLMAGNPLLAAGWIAGSELIWKGGKRLGKKAMDAYLLSLVRQTLGIIAWETAGIYDSTHRYRNPDWVFGVELAHLLSRFDATQDVLREAFRELGRLPLRSSYDRIFLYRCIAQNRSPKPKQFAQPELLPVETRRQLLKKLEAFYDDHIAGDADLESSGADKWRVGLRDRLGLA